MKTSLSSNRERGLTLIELLVILAVVAVLASLLFPQLIREKRKALRIHCVNNLRLIGLSCRLWDGDAPIYPMEVAGTRGGTIDFITGPNAWRHFQVMSNLLATPKVLICPAESDRMRVSATNFDYMSNSNISYFVGVDATDMNPEMMLSGDRNLTNGTPLRNAILELTTNRPSGWTAEMHHGIGNVGLADGGVKQLSTLNLRSTVANTGVATNRLQMPILGP